MDEGSTHQEVDLDDRIGILADLMQKVISFRITLDSETDRGAALMVAGYLDELFKGLLAARVVDDPKAAKTAFSLTGPLSTFSSRIDLAYLLGVLPRGHRAELHVIRGIRNKFAHEPGLLTFSSPTIAPECRKLMHHGTDAETGDPGSLFRRAALAMVTYVVVQTKRIERITPAEEIPATNTDARVESLLASVKAHWKSLDTSDT